MKQTDVYFELNHSPQVPVEASVFAPETWPFSLQWLPVPTYLVGGNVRDALLGRHAEYLDLDFVLPEGAVETAKVMANQYGAGFVLLDPERQIARVVFERATVDFAQQVGDTLEEDLQRRDFTINAIAYNPMTGQLLDPLQGCADLQQKSICMIAPENLKEDPLRLLRAYRQAAQLEFTLDSATQHTIQQLSGLIEQVAAERVQTELNYLLSTPKGTPFLKMVWQDGLLEHWLSHTTAGGLSIVANVDQAAIALKQRWSAFERELSSWHQDQQKTSGTARSWLKIAKLACLIDPDAHGAEQELWRLKYSRAEVQGVLTVLKFLPQIQSPALATLSRRDQYYFFQGAGAVFPALAVLAIALGQPLEAIAPLISRFLNPSDPIAHPVPALTGRELMVTLKLPPGPKIGYLLEAIQLATAEGKIATAEEALEFAKTLICFDTVQCSGNGLQQS